MTIEEIEALEDGFYWVKNKHRKNIEPTLKTGEYFTLCCHLGRQLNVAQMNEYFTGFIKIKPPVEL